MVWRERNYAGAGVGGRRPGVNIVDSGKSSSTPLDLSKYCPKCNFALSYLKDLDIWVCKCGYGVPKDMLTPPSPSSSQPNNNNDKNGPSFVNDNNNEAGETNNDIFVVSKSTRSEDLANRTRRLPGEDRDTSMLQAKGMTIVDSQEVLPPGDADTISSDELYYSNSKAGVNRHYRRNNNNND